MHEVSADEITRFEWHDESQRLRCYYRPKGQEREQWCYADSALLNELVQLATRNSDAR